MPQLRRLCILCVRISRSWMLNICRSGCSMLCMFSCSVLTVAEMEKSNFDMFLRQKVCLRMSSVQTVFEIMILRRYSLLVNDFPLLFVEAESEQNSLLQVCSRNCKYPSIKSNNFHQWVLAILVIVGIINSFSTVQYENILLE